MHPNERFSFFYKNAKDGNLENILAALKTGESPNIGIFKNGRLVSPISRLASEGHFAAVQLLLSAAERIDQINSVNDEPVFGYAMEEVCLINAISGYAMGGYIDEVNVLIKKPSKNPRVAVSHVDRINTAICGYALSDNIERVNELLNENPTSRDLAIFSYAIGGHADSVKELQGEASSMAFRGYAIGGHKTVDELLEMGASMQDLIHSFALGGHKEEVNDLLKRDSNSKYKNLACHGYATTGQVKNVDELIAQKGTSKLIAFYGYKLGHHKQQMNNLLNSAQYEEQILKRKVNIMFVLLGAVFLTPLSLLVTIPLFIRSILNEPIKKLVTTKKTSDDVKLNRQTWRGTNLKVIDENKPKKTILSKSASKEVYLVDQAQLQRFKLFAKRNFRKISQHEIEQSKDASKDIIRCAEINLKMK